MFEEEKTSSLSKAQDKISHVTSLMKNNIGKMMSNTAQLEDIESSSQALSGTASRFREKSRALRDQSRAGRWKPFIYIGLFAILFAFILYLRSPSEVDSHASKGG